MPFYKAVYIKKEKLIDETEPEFMYPQWSKKEKRMKKELRERNSLSNYQMRYVSLKGIRCQKEHCWRSADEYINQYYLCRKHAHEEKYTLEERIQILEEEVRDLRDRDNDGL